MPQFGDLFNGHRSIHAAPPIDQYLTSSSNTGTDFIIENPEPKVDKKKNISKIAATSSSDVIVAPKPTPKIYTAMVGAAHHYGSSSVSASSYSSTPSLIVKLSPPLINKDINHSSFDDRMNPEKNNAAGIPWLAPLLGVLGALGAIVVAMMYYIHRNKKKKLSAAASMTIINPSSNNRHGSPRGEALTHSYASWASFSTINPSAEHYEDKKLYAHHSSSPPPAYTSKQQKRLTADTLVDEVSLLMLKNQYSPQLAFSPSLIAGEFQQQQQQLAANELKSLPLLPNMMAAILSPSNTLIDNSVVLLSKDEQANNDDDDYYYEHPKKKIYEPQVNFDDNPFVIPYYSYSNEKSKKNSTEEQDKKRNDIYKKTENNNDYHVVKMDSDIDTTTTSK